MKNLETLLNQFESRIPLFAKENSEISKSNVGWHIEHSLLTIMGYKSCFTIQSVKL